MVEFPPKASIFSNYIVKQLYNSCHEMQNHSLKKEVVNLHTLQIHLEAQLSWAMPEINL